MTFTTPLSLLPYKRVHQHSKIIFHTHLHRYEVVLCVCTFFCWLETKPTMVRSLIMFIKTKSHYLCTKSKKNFVQIHRKWVRYNIKKAVELHQIAPEMLLSFSARNHTESDSILKTHIPTNKMLFRLFWAHTATSAKRHKHAETTYTNNDTNWVCVYFQQTGLCLFHSPSHNLF